MRLIPLPYRIHTRLQLADVILIAALLAFAAVCLSGYKT